MSKGQEVLLEEGTCTICGILFALPKDFLDTKRKNGSVFYCPNGHRLDAIEEPTKQQKKQTYHHWYYEHVTKPKRLQAKQAYLSPGMERQAAGDC